MTRPAIVVVSHSEEVARGVVAIAAQMAPDVAMRAAGGTDDGRIGTSFDKVMTAVTELLEQAGAVVVLTDLGSATMTTEAVLDVLDDARITLADGPLVEGAVAAAVAAQNGADLAAVRKASEDAALEFPAARQAHPSAASEEPSQPDRQADAPVERVFELRNQLGLHARAAAMLARAVASFDARVEVNGVDGTSVLALMSLGLPRGAVMQLRATGPEAEHVLDAVGRIVADRFGED